MVVVFQLVDGLEFASNIELLGRVVKVADRRVLLIAAEDVESFLRPAETLVLVHL